MVTTDRDDEFPNDKEYEQMEDDYDEIQFEMYKEKKYGIY